MNISDIEEIGIEKNFSKPGTILFHTGQNADNFYYILEGEIRVYKTDINGKEVEVASFGKGHFVGEVILFAGKEYPVTASVVKKTKALSFNKDRLLKAIEKNPTIAMFFLKLMANKCLVLNTRLESIALQTVRQRLIQYLYTQCSGDKECKIMLTIKKTDLAKRLGTISETLSRTLNQIQKEKLIKVEGKTIHILQCERLRNELKACN
ncbi:MAG: hypothetical protein A2Y40_04975 [Candidatus Margulisbacteria bacterium GWF2_35_9]|nr:MAG: hypothetical protein A2Y40_04975 [Candidatus Margulisbacteria bacterium GWF2_35_9]